MPERVDRFLDLGCGDGRLLALVRSRNPEADGVGVDVSEPMLKRAKTRFAGESQITFCAHDMGEPLVDASMVTERAPFDAVVSALAIHHLTDERKRSLLGEVHALLAPGGAFINLDLVCSASPAAHERFREAIGRREDDPSDRPAPLCDQLAWLADAGFQQVDCRFKWMEMALMIGVRTGGRDA